MCAKDYNFQSFFLFLIELNFWVLSLAYSFEIYVCICCCIKKRRILPASLPAGFYAFPINFLNMSSAKWTLLNLIGLFCEFLFSICLLLCLCSLLLQSYLLLSILLRSLLNCSWLLCLGVLFCCYMCVFFSTLKKKGIIKIIDGKRWILVVV